MSEEKHEYYPGTVPAEPQAKAMGIDFNNRAMNEQVAKNLHVKRNVLKDILLPPVGTKFVLQGLVYSITYTRANPFRITAEPCGVVQEEKAEDVKKE